MLGQVMEMALQLRDSSNSPLLSVEAVVGGEVRGTPPQNLEQSQALSGSVLGQEHSSLGTAQGSTEQAHDPARVLTFLFLPSSCVPAPPSHPLLWHGCQGWPSEPPQVVVATPAALMNQLFAADPRRMRRAAFVRDLAMLVSGPSCWPPEQASAAAAEHADVFPQGLEQAAPWAVKPVLPSLTSTVHPWF